MDKFHKNTARDINQLRIKAHGSAYYRTRNERTKEDSIVMANRIEALEKKLNKRK